MYARPEPDPFHRDWCEGYDDGLADTPRSSKIHSRPDFYSDGYAAGQLERLNLDELGSSNA